MKTDNYKAVWLAIYNFILENPLEGEGLADRRESIAKHLPEKNDFGPFFNMEVRRGEVSVTFCLQMEVEYDATCEEGNRWYHYTLETKLSWPGHGAASLDLAGERIALYQEVHQYAQKLSEMVKSMGPIWHMAMTKAQVEEQSLRHLQCHTQNVLRDLVEDGDGAKGMKVGETRLVTPKSPLVVGVEVTKEVKKLGRTFTYTVKVENPTLVSIQRS